MDEPKKHKLEETRWDDSSGGRPQQYLQKTRTDLSGSGLLETATDITSFAEASQLPGVLTEHAPDAQRFELLTEVGKGATGSIYAMRDHSLKRTIAVKFLPKSAHQNASVQNKFMHEAEVTAGLEHPNIMPVYDIGATKDGRLFFSMKKIEGCSLGDAIRKAKAKEEPPEEFRTIDGRVRIFLKVCDALAYAHFRGCVHQDVKPDNIMLGRFGEVLLLDWGSALRKEGADGDVGLRFLGTPAYMSPEQARRESVDERSDVYSLGASLYQALTLKHPTWADDPEAFWAKKRRGDIDPLTDRERRAVPAALLDIALKAMAADPARRYATVEELAADLKRYQARQRVLAHRESALETAGRLYRKHRRVILTASSLLAVVAGVSSLLFREKIKEMMTWTLYHAEDFSTLTTAQLGRDWRQFSSRDWWTIDTLAAAGDSGAWTVKNGVLAGTNVWGFDNISYNRDIPGDIRVEWESRALVANANLNCFIGGPTRFGGYMFHVGGFGDPRRVRLSKGRTDQALDEVFLSTGIRTGQTYRFRMEREGKRVRLFMDGTKLIDVLDLDVVSGRGRQTFGFEVNGGNAVRIDNIRIYNHPLPQKIEPIVAADRFYERGHYGEALEQYREIAAVYPGTEMAGWAQYGAARCLDRLDSAAAAVAAFGEFERRHPDHELTAMALYERSRIHERTGDTAAVSECYRELAARYPGNPLLRKIFLAMSLPAHERSRSLSLTNLYDTTANLAELAWVKNELARLYGWGRAFGIDMSRMEFFRITLTLLSEIDADGAEALFLRYPDFPEVFAEHLVVFGYFERALETFPAGYEWLSRAAYNLGEFRKVVSTWNKGRDFVAAALVQLGQYDQVAAHFLDQPWYRAMALNYAGRFDELLNQYPDIGASSTNLPLTPMSANDLGRFDEYGNNTAFDYQIAAKIWLNIMGRPDTALAILRSAPGTGDIIHRVLESQCLRELGRFREALDRSIGAFGMSQTAAEMLVCMGDREGLTRLLSRQRLARYFYHAEAGEFDAALQAVKADRNLYLTGLLQAGRFERIRAEFGSNRDIMARILLHLRRYDELVEHYPDQRFFAAEALLRAGRFDDLFARYPDMRSACARALYRTGRSEEAIRQYPESRPLYADYLIDKGRYDTVMTGFRDQPLRYGLACVLAGRYADVPYREGRYCVSSGQYADLLALQALRLWNAGDRRQARATMKTPHVTAFYGVELVANRFGEYLLLPVLEGLGGDTASMARQCRRLAVEHAARMNACLRYEALYLAGDITDSAFLAQPYGWDAQERHLFFKALRDDLAGRREEALAGYRACPDPWDNRQLQFIFTVTFHQLLDSRTVRQFIEWRIKTLDAQQSAAPAP